MASKKKSNESPSECQPQLKESSKRAEVRKQREEREMVTRRRAVYVLQQVSGRPR